MATNIIERLFIEVGLDFSKLASEADKAIATSNKLEGSLSGTEKASGKANKALGDLAKGKAKASAGAENLAKGLTKAAKVLTGFFATLMAATGLNKLINEVQQANNELYFLEKNLGMSAQSIKSWQNAAAASGGTAEGMTASLKGLSRSMNDFVIMGDTSMLPYFNALGVSMVDGTGKVRELDDVMLDLSDSLSRMDRKQAYSIGAAMGLDEGTLNTLLQGRDAMQEMLDIQKSMYHSSEKELEASRELSKQQAILNAHWESLKTMIANALIPILLKLTKVVNEWMGFIQRNERQVRHVFEMLSFIIGMILIPLFGKALMAALAFIAPFAPFILVVTALSAAFILLYDDYKTWAEGGKSLFDWTWFQRMIDGSTFSVKGLKDAFKELAQDVVNFVMPSLRDALDVIDKIKSGDFKGALASLTSLYMRPVEAIADAGHWAVEKAANGVDAVAGVDKNDPASISAKVRSDKRIGSQLGDKVRDAVGYGGTGQIASNGKASVNGPASKNSISGFIGKGEGGYNSVNLGKRYGYRAGTRDLVNMTVAEVYAMQKRREVNAVGKFQIIRDTMPNVIKGMGLTGKEKFDKEMQERMGAWLFFHSRPSLGGYLRGEHGNRNKAGDEGAREWASLPVLSSTLTTKANGRTFHSRRGSTAYSDGVNKAQHKATDYEAALDNARGIYQGAIRQGHSKADAEVMAFRGVSQGAQTAQQMINQNQGVQQSPKTTNNNQKYIDVKIDRVNVQSSSSTISGTTGDALKGVASNVGQIVAGMT